MALALILLAALAMRLSDLEGPRSGFPDLFDEGIRAEQLFLMDNGFRPYRDIYAAQGPLLLHTLYPFYRVFGETLGAVRLGVGLLSLVGLVGAYLAARQVGGRLGGVLACLLLALSPAYLEGSRLALAEVPSLAPALLALALALRYQLSGGRRWLLLSALLYATALLLKPMVFPVGLAIAAALIATTDDPRLTSDDHLPHRRSSVVRRRLFDLALFALVVAVVVTVVVVLMGARDVFEQLVLYRAGATAASAWDARASWKEAIQGPLSGQPSLYALASLGALLLLSSRPRQGAPLVIWLLATFLLLFFYTPLHPKHLVYLAPPAAVLGGAGLGMAWRLVLAERGRVGGALGLIRAGAAAGAVLLLAWDVVAVQPALARGVQVSVDQTDQDLHVFDEAAARTLQALVPPNEFVLTDHPYIAFLARRMVPPELVDPSRGRARAGTLTDEVAAAAAS